MEQKLRKLCSNCQHLSLRLAQPAKKFARSEQTVSMPAAKPVARPEAQRLAQYFCTTGGHINVCRVRLPPRYSERYLPVGSD